MTCQYQYQCHHCHHRAGWMSAFGAQHFGFCEYRGKCSYGTVSTGCPGQQDLPIKFIKGPDDQCGILSFCDLVWSGSVHYKKVTLTYLHTRRLTDLQYSMFFSLSSWSSSCHTVFLRSIVLSVKESFFGKCKGAKGDAADDKARKEKEGNK